MVSTAAIKVEISAEGLDRFQELVERLEAAAEKLQAEDPASL